MTTTEAGYGLRTRVDLSYEEAIEAATAALKEEGFGILTQIDVQETFKNKLGVDFQPYVILGACNPNLAHEALGLEPDLGLLLPCNVIIHENNDGPGSIVSIIDPQIMMQVAANPDMATVAAEARTRLMRVAAILANDLE